MNLNTQLQFALGLQLWLNTHAHIEFLFPSIVAHCQHFSERVFIERQQTEILASEIIWKCQWAKTGKQGEKQANKKQAEGANKCKCKCNKSNNHVEQNVQQNQTMFAAWAFKPLKAERDCQFRAPITQYSIEYPVQCNEYRLPIAADCWLVEQQAHVVFQWESCKKPGHDFDFDIVHKKQRTF